MENVKYEEGKENDVNTDGTLEISISPDLPPDIKFTSNATLT